jgi:HSP20 family protein
MPLRPDPLKELLDLQERMNRLFDQTLARTRGEEEGIAASTWMPAVDIYETPDRVVMKAELPGLSREDVEINVRDNTLSLRGERRFEKEVKEENYLRIERAYGSFQRSFSLPATIQQEKIKAIFKDGVLEVTLPKAEEARPKQIKIDVK